MLRESVTLGESINDDPEFVGLPAIIGGMGVVARMRGISEVVYQAIRDWTG